MTIRLQHLSAINVVVAKATGGGDRVYCSRLLTNLFPYDDGKSLPNGSSIEFSAIKENDEDEEVGRHWSI